MSTRKPYPSDLSELQWQNIHHLFPGGDRPRHSPGRPRTYSRNGPNRWAGVVRDSVQKIRIDKETARKEGKPYLRVLISFPQDAKPSDEERRLLKQENFTFDGESWGKELNGSNVLLAKQVVNQIYKLRGDDYQLFLG